MIAARAISWRVAVLILLAAGALSTGAAHGHALAPSLLSLEERESGRVEMRWQSQRPQAEELTPILPSHCVEDAEATLRWDGARRIEERTLRCTGSLVGAEIRIAGLEGSATPVVLRTTLADGQRQEALLSARFPVYVVKARRAPAAVLGAFFALGIEHLSTGFDHLLFVLGLVLLLGFTRSLAGAVTAFTLGHSLTLALGVSGWLQVPGTWVELGIALTLVALAAEIVGSRAGVRATALHRRPVAMAFGFGLFHGMGFAGALAAAGLPAAEAPLALVGFNLGIEAGQLLWVAVLWATVPLLGPLPRHWRRRAPAWAAEAMGAIGIYLCLARIADTLGG